VPEGTHVEAGQVVARLDASPLEEERLQRQIECNTREAAVIEAQGNWERAQAELEEFRQGVYPQERQAIEHEIAAAESKWARAKADLEERRGGAAENPALANDLASLEFDVEMAQRELERAKTRLHVFETYTKTRRLQQLESDTKTAQAMLHSAEQSRRLAGERLETIQKQIDLCTIRAPQPGQLFYAHLPAEGNRPPVIIAEGTLVRRHQAIALLSDPEQMLLRATIPENEIGLVRAGMPVAVYVDGFPTYEFEGTVEKVHPYPTAGTRSSPEKKRYATTITIKDPPPVLRPRLTAEAEITVARLQNVLEVPAEAVFERDGQPHCRVYHRGKVEIRPVETGPGNGRLVVIDQGLQAGEEVVVR